MSCTRYTGPMFRGLRGYHPDASDVSYPKDEQLWITVVDIRSQRADIYVDYDRPGWSSRWTISTFWIWCHDPIIEEGPI